MAELSLNEMEREVEAARGKLATDLSVLRSPATAAEFTEGLKQEALEAKDALIEKAKRNVQSSAEALIEDVKARAAANPAAALAVGAGIAWRLIRHPPIATALVGAGLLSLFRTRPADFHGGAPSDYVAHAKTRLAEQTQEIAGAAAEKAIALRDTLSENLSETATKVRERVSDWTTEAISSARKAAEDSRAVLASAEARSSESRLGDAVDHAWVPMDNPLIDQKARDAVLLGAAGLAVAAALGFACQRRLGEQS